MEGPYRDLGSGFARLTGVEGARRGPSRIAHVEDALLELLRNARDAGAASIFVASSLARRRFRTLTVIDDGRGIPDAYADLVFEPGVTTRHLDPVRDGQNSGAPHGAGLSLYHLKQCATDAQVLSASSPTAIRATFDTRSLPERALQSAARTSRTNLLATVRTFVGNLDPDHTPTVHYGPDARILATLIDNHIIQPSEDVPALHGRAERLGLGVSRRTVHRVLKREILPLGPATPDDTASLVGPASGSDRVRYPAGGPVLALGPDERAQIAAILSRAARAGFLEVEDLKVEARPGEVSLTARVYEPEEEYE